MDLISRELAKYIAIWSVRVINPKILLSACFLLTSLYMWFDGESNIPLLGTKFWLRLPIVRQVSGNHLQYSQKGRQIGVASLPTTSSLNENFPTRIIIVKIMNLSESFAESLLTYNITWLSEFVEHEPK